MNRRERNLQLAACAIDGIEGCGNEMALLLRAERTTKAGTYEIYRLRLRLDRYDLKLLLRGVRAMHARDRERLAAELRRIEEEAAILTKGDCT